MQAWLQQFSYAAKAGKMNMNNRSAVSFLMLIG